MTRRFRTAAATGAAVAVGAAFALAAVNPAIAADEDDGNEGTVNVGVAIAPITKPGVLAMSIAGTDVALSENGSTPLERQFTGTLPTVTVTDTRTAEEIPDDAAWYVLGTASDFTGDGLAPIGAGHLGWQPTLLDGGETGLVAAGDEVVTVLDDPTQPGNNVGLVDKELLAITAGSEDVASEGSWTVNANLFLRTEPTVQPGDYSSIVTLSLFE